uniref:Cyclic nucleotide-binding domain-containing protein n=1 Tax=Mesocestoides corti TaxID=53468 RepID=A0A5K3FLW8_MESCO
MGFESAEVFKLLSISPERRTNEDIAQLFEYLRSIEGLVSLRPSSQRDAALREICRIARPLHVKGDTMLYRRGEPSTSWYILLSGSVLIESSMFLPRNCFGTRLNGSVLRHQDCFVLEDSDLIVIKYIDRDPLQTGSPQNKTTPPPRAQFPPSSSKILVVPSNAATAAAAAAAAVNGSQALGGRKVSQHVPPERQSSLSGSDSAISRTVTTASNSSSSLQGGAGVDSDSDGGEDEDDDEEEEEDEFDSGSSSHESLRDSFWDALLKEPRSRTPADVEILVENVQKLPAFSSLSSGTRYALCRLMLVAVVREAGQVVLSDGEILDTWSVILNGTVEVVEADGTIRELTSGDAFGVRLPPAGNSKDAASTVVPPPQRHRGQMRTVTEDCQFVCVAQADYLRIMAQAADAEVPELEEDGGRVVLVYEDIKKEQQCAGLPTSSPACRLVIKGTPEKLIDHLKCPEPGDPSYPEDLLLTYRTFLPTPALLVTRFLSWWEASDASTDRALRARIQRYVLLWVHNHPEDFHDRPAMLRFLSRFSDLLQRESGIRRLLHLACSTKARQRIVEVPFTLVVGAQHQQAHIVLPFVLVGGQGDFGIFINQAEDDGGDSKRGDDEGYELRPGLRRGDQVNTVQHSSVEGMSLAQLASVLASIVMNGVNQRQAPGSTSNRSISLAVTFNPSHFYELMSNVGELELEFTTPV